MIRINLCFNEDNPKHMQAVEFLEAQGRKKTKILANIIDEYLQNNDIDMSEMKKTKPTKKKVAATKPKKIVKEKVVKETIMKDDTEQLQKTPLKQLQPIISNVPEPVSNNYSVETTTNIQESDTSNSDSLIDVVNIENSEEVDDIFFSNLDFF